jgi:hypothetical protein
MKQFKLLLMLLAAITLVIGVSSVAQAMHGGGVGHCDACHSMHNSADNPVGGTISSLLLKGSDASSTCLNCHAGSGGYHIASDTLDGKSSGGDFGWVKTDYSVIVRGNPVVFEGKSNGHNIVAGDYGYIADDVNTTAPGGTYSANLLGCTSCHDAHGQVKDGTKGGSGAISVSGSYGAADPVDGSIHGNYRLLGDDMYEAGNHDSDGYAFTADAPVARANGSNGYSVDYGSGMSEWCANCHSYVGQGGKHVAGSAALMNGQATIYNSYIATGSWVAGGGNAASAYDALVPFERGITDGSLLDTTNTAGPDSASNVMCLTCHRAHASAHANMGRWDFEVELLEESHALAAGDLPATAVPYYKNGAAVDVVAAYGPYQRSLCNKCHAQD